MSMYSDDADPRYLDHTDHQLIAEHLAGDVDAFGELARRHVRFLHNVARQLITGHTDAEDVVQTALISALRSSSNYQRRASVRTWLARITINAAIDSRRRSNRVAAAEPPSDDVWHGVTPDPGGIVAGQLTVEALLDSLPIRQRRMVLMVDMLGFSVRETAECLGVPEGTVKSARSRAHAALARRIR